MNWHTTLHKPAAMLLHTLEGRWHEVRGQRVLVRVDLNVPLDSDKSLLLDPRLQRAVRLSRQLQFMGCRVILASHWGRPDGRPDPDLSLRPFVEVFSKLFGLKVAFLSTHTGTAVKKVMNSRPGSVFLLENLRFHPGEVTADPQFAWELACLADCFVMDAFSVSHRAHASVVALPKMLPTYAGPSFAEEYYACVDLLRRIRGPVVMMAGGRKLDKLLSYRMLLPGIDHLLIGSGFAPDLIAQPDLLGSSGQTSNRVLLPPDLLIPPGGDWQQVRPVPLRETEPELLPVDIGPEAINLYCEAIRNAGTVLFNGALGILPPGHPMSSHKPILQAMAESRALKVVCGGMGGRLFGGSHAPYRVDYLFLGGGSTLAFLATHSTPVLPHLAPRQRPSYESLAVPGMEG